MVVWAWVGSANARRWCAHPGRIAILFGGPAFRQLVCALPPDIGWPGTGQFAGRVASIGRQVVLAANRRRNKVDANFNRTRYGLVSGFVWLGGYCGLARVASCPVGWRVFNAGRSGAMNLNSRRARQARLSVLLASRFWRGLLVISVLVLMISGGWLLYAGSLLGWMVVTLAAWPLMVLVWYDWWLKDLPVAKSAQSIDDILEPALLGKLHVGINPKQLAQIAARERGGIFFATRFGLGPNFVSMLSSEDPADLAAIWQTARQFQRELQMPTLSTPVVIAALVRNIPDRDKLLAQMQLTFEDVLAGIKWYHHLEKLMAESQQRKTGGGIGRDMSFGYTPLLGRFAQNISMQTAGGTLLREVDGHTQLINELTKQLSTGRQNAVLVGPAGAGKTTLVYALAEKLLQPDSNVPGDLRYCQIMALDPATLIASAGERGALESLVGRLITEAHAAKNVILFFDNAELFFGDQVGAVDLRNVLMPVLEGGGVRMVLSLDEQQFLKLNRDSPALAQQLNRIMVPGMDEASTMLVCEDQVLFYEYDHDVTYMHQALKAAYRLGQRYVSDQAMPGQALQILQAAAAQAENGLVTASGVEKAVEKTFGVKVGSARSEDERQVLLNLESLLHERMINQTRAVSVVSNALRRARSGVRNQNRPIGSFLFLGPTGVGKTELAKALAAVYFGGEDHIVRVDLNEFGQSGDASRLIADAAKDPHSLTAQIAKQPFSVVLLDEIEKAHSNVLNTLLQMLDEGILRDATGREVSFRDAIVIATSNAGADKIRQYISDGKKPEEFEEEFVNGLIDIGQFRPEFLNRFDEITVFRPLKPDELLQVVDLILAGVNKTLAQQSIKVEVAADAKKKLVEAGNDPRLGARPMRRVVQRSVENIVAKKLLEGKVAPGTTVQVHLDEIEEALKTQ